MHELDAENPVSNEGLIDLAGQMLTARRALEGLLASPFFADVALDLLLVIFAHGPIVSQNELIRQTLTSPSTTCRWIKALESEDMIENNADGWALTVNGIARMSATLRKIQSGRGGLRSV